MIAVAFGVTRWDGRAAVPVRDVDLRGEDPAGPSGRSANTSPPKYLYAVCWVSSKSNEAPIDRTFFVPR